MPAAFFFVIWHYIGMYNTCGIWVLTFIFGISSAQASRQLILKIVGSVENQIVSNRDVEASFIVDRALYNDGHFIPITLGSEEFTNALNRLLIESMVCDEANTFGVAKVSDSEVEQALALVRNSIARGGSVKGRWSNLGFNGPQLKEMVGRKLKANKFIKYKSNSSYVQVSDEDAREYFNKNRLKFGTMDFEGFKGSIKKFLEKKNAEDRLRDWLNILRKKHRVKTLLGGTANESAASGGG